jgi:hypothetical protein
MATWIAAYLFCGFITWVIVWISNYRYGTPWHTFQGFLAGMLLWLPFLIFQAYKGCKRVIRHEWWNA